MQWWNNFVNKLRLLQLNFREYNPVVNKGLGSIFTEDWMRQISEESRRGQGPKRIENSQDDSSLILNLDIKNQSCVTTSAFT